MLLLSPSQTTAVAWFVFSPVTCPADCLWIVRIPPSSSEVVSMSGSNLPSASSHLPFRIWLYVL